MITTAKVQKKTDLYKYSTQKYVVQHKIQTLC